MKQRMREKTVCKYRQRKHSSCAVFVNEDEHPHKVWLIIPYELLQYFFAKSDANSVSLQWFSMKKLHKWVYLTMLRNYVSVAVWFWERILEQTLEKMKGFPRFLEIVFQAAFPKLFFPSDFSRYYPERIVIFQGRVLHDSIGALKADIWGRPRGGMHLKSGICATKTFFPYLCQ